MLLSKGAATVPAGNAAEAISRRPCPSQAPGANSEQTTRKAKAVLQGNAERMATRMESLPQACRRWCRLETVRAAFSNSESFKTHHPGGKNRRQESGVNGRQNELQAEDISQHLPSPLPRAAIKAFALPASQSEAHMKLFQCR